MRQSMAILTRELGERRQLWWLGLLAWLPWGLRGLGVVDFASDSQIGFAMGEATAVVAILAVLLGASVIGNDLAERRLGFYFSRPISGLSLWVGKLGAAIVQTLGIGALMVLPSLLLGARPDPAFDAWRYLAWISLGALLLIAAAHAVGVMVRARRGWLALDLAALILAALALGIPGLAVWRQTQGAVLALPITLVGLALLAVFATAGALQVARGRSDPARGHRALSLALGPALVAVAAAVAGYAYWFFHPRPGDLAFEHFAASPDGRWLALSGTAAGRGTSRHRMLVELPTGRTFRPRADPRGSCSREDELFSDDGRRALWFERGEGGCGLVTLDLGRTAAAPVARPVYFTAESWPIAVSPDGSRIAVENADRLTVSTIDDGRLLASLPLQAGADSVLRFSGAEELLAYRLQGKEIEASAIHLPDGRIRPFGRVAVNSFSWDISPDGRRLLGDHDSAYWLFDLPSGRPLRRLDPGSSAKFLLDGRIVQTARRGGEAVLQILAPDGTPLGASPFFRAPGAKWIWPMAQSDPRHLLVTLERPGQRRPVVLDLERGTRRAPVLLDLKLGSREVASSADEDLIVAFDPFLVKLPAAGLFRTRAGLVMVNPTTGGTRRLPA